MSLNNTLNIKACINIDLNRTKLLEKLSTEVQK